MMDYMVKQWSYVAMSEHVGCPKWHVLNLDLGYTACVYFLSKCKTWG